MDTYSSTWQEDPRDPDGRFLRHAGDFLLEVTGEDNDWGYGFTLYLYAYKLGKRDKVFLSGGGSYHHLEDAQKVCEQALINLLFGAAYGRRLLYPDRE